MIIPVLKDVGELTTNFGQLVLAAASIADFGAVILLSFFFSGEGGPGSTAVLLGVFVGLLAVTFFVVRGAERSRRVGTTFCASRTRAPRSAFAPRCC